MNDLVVIAFDNVEDARSGLKRFRDLEHYGKMRLEDTAIVQRDADGKLHVKNEVSGTTETASAVGGFIGLFLAVAFPVAGLAIGAGLGALAGRAMHTGVDKAFIDEVKDKLQPGKSALFAVVKEADPDAIRAAFRTMHGEVLQTTLPPEEEAALQSTLSGHQDGSI